METWRCKHCKKISSGDKSDHLLVCGMLDEENVLEMHHRVVEDQFDVVCPLCKCTMFHSDIVFDPRTCQDVCLDCKMEGEWH